MSKLSMYGKILYEKDEVCPHNKIPANYKTTYRQSAAIRLNDISHLRRLGAGSSHQRCGDCNQRVCTCLWSRKGYSLPREATGKVKKYASKLPERDYDSEKSCNLRTSLLENFYERLKRYKTTIPKTKVGAKDSVTWIMRPNRQMRTSNMNLTHSATNWSSSKYLRRRNDLVKKRSQSKNIKVQETSTGAKSAKDYYNEKRRNRAEYIMTENKQSKYSRKKHELTPVSSRIHRLAESCNIKLDDILAKSQQFQPGLDKYYDLKKSIANSYRSNSFNYPSLFKLKRNCIESISSRRSSTSQAMEYVAVTTQDTSQDSLDKHQLRSAPNQLRVQKHHTETQTSSTSLKATNSGLKKTEKASPSVSTDVDENAVAKEKQSNKSVKLQSNSKKNLAKRKAKVKAYRKPRKIRKHRRHTVAAVTDVSKAKEVPLLKSKSASDDTLKNESDHSWETVQRVQTYMQPAGILKKPQQPGSTLDDKVKIKIRQAVQHDRTMSPPTEMSNGSVPNKMPTARMQVASDNVDTIKSDLHSPAQIQAKFASNTKLERMPDGANYKLSFHVPVTLTINKDNKRGLYQKEVKISYP